MASSDFNGEPILILSLADARNVLRGGLSSDPWSQEEVATFRKVENFLKEADDKHRPNADPSQAGG